MAQTLHNCTVFFFVRLLSLWRSVDLSRAEPSPSLILFLTMIKNLCHRKTYSCLHDPLNKSDTAGLCLWSAVIYTDEHIKRSMWSLLFANNQTLIHDIWCLMNNETKQLWLMTPDVFLLVNGMSFPSPDNIPKGGNAICMYLWRWASCDLVFMWGWEMNHSC